jgi:ubiquitin conjugation factor E4 A
MAAFMPPSPQVMVNSMYWTPQGPNCNGKSFETKTILGRVLRPSSVPNSPHKPSEHFPLDATLLQREAVEGQFSVQADQDAHIDQIHKVFCRLLRAGQEIKSAVIRWLVQCLEANKDRGKMMARMQPVMDTSMSTCASDGFFLNLCWIMLKLAAPFAKQDAPLIRSIDPLYCLVKASESVDAQLDFRSETRMSPQDPEEGDLQPTRPETEFNFITQCFFLTHTTLTLGLSQIIQRFVDLMGLYERTLKSLQNIAAAGGEGGPLYDRMQTQFHLLHSQIHGFKAHMDHPNLQELCLTFLVTTARWLVWLATQRSHDPSSKSCDPALDSHDPDSLFPLPTKAPPQMRAVPECLVDNISHFVAHLRRSKSDLLRNETHLLGHLITFATVFMGSPLYIKNPHTRANISQLVFLMIPPTNSPTSTGLIPSEEEPQQLLFEGHKVATAHLVRMLMRIFVDIEFTGDSMEFEAKFQYRIPMYKILKFVWKLPTYQTSIDVLTTEAVDYDGSKQEIPIFLRFINMIINDATVQLDEGLENLVLIGELQRKRQSEWDSYNDEQKKEVVTIHT